MVMYGSGTHHETLLVLYSSACLLNAAKLYTRNNTKLPCNIGNETEHISGQTTSALICMTFKLILSATLYLASP